MRKFFSDTFVMQSRELALEELDEVSGGKRWLAEGLALIGIEKAIDAAWAAVSAKSGAAPLQELDYLNGYHGA